MNWPAWTAALNAIRADRSSSPAVELDSVGSFNKAFGAEVALGVGGCNLLAASKAGEGAVGEATVFASGAAAIAGAAGDSDVRSDAGSGAADVGTTAGAVVGGATGAGGCIWDPRGRVKAESAASAALERAGIDSAGSSADTCARSGPASDPTEADGTGMGEEGAEAAAFGSALHVTRGVSSAVAGDGVALLFGDVD